MDEAPQEITIILVPLWQYIEEKCPEDRNFHEALGSFVWLFSLIEAEANDLIQYYMKISRKRLNILTSQLRMDNGLDVLNRIKSSGLVPENDFENLGETVRHLREINRFKNDFLHHSKREGSAPHQLMITNSYFSRPNVRPSVRMISAKTIKSAEIDLALIRDRIYALMGAIPDDGLLREPWRYKPQSPLPHDQPRSQGRRQRRGNQQAASPL